jgi:hypothetical protein
MTWYLNPDTGELTDPNGSVVGVVDGPPYTVPDDAQAWGEAEFRTMSMSELTTDEIADFAQLWTGDVEVRRE